MHPAGQAMRGMPPGMAKMELPSAGFKWSAGKRISGGARSAHARLILSHPLVRQQQGGGGRSA